MLSQVRKTIGGGVQREVLAQADKGADWNKRIKESGLQVAGLSISSLLGDSTDPAEFAKEKGKKPTIGTVLSSINSAAAAKSGAARLSAVGSLSDEEYIKHKRGRSKRSAVEDDDDDDDDDGDGDQYEQDGWLVDDEPEIVVSANAAELDSLLTAKSKPSSKKSQSAAKYIDAMAVDADSSSDDDDYSSSEEYDSGDEDSSSDDDDDAAPGSHKNQDGGSDNDSSSSSAVSDGEIAALRSQIFAKQKGNPRGGSNATMRVEQATAEIEKKYSKLEKLADNGHSDMLGQIALKFTDNLCMRRTQMVKNSMQTLTEDIMTVLFGQIVVAGKPASNDPGYYLEISNSLRKSEFVQQMIELLTKFGNSRSRTPTILLVNRLKEALSVSSSRTTMPITTVEVRDCTWINLSEDSPSMCICGGSVVHVNGAQCRVAAVVCLPRQQNASTGMRKTNVEKGYDSKMMLTLCDRAECAHLCELLGVFCVTVHLLVMLSTAFLVGEMEKAKKSGSAVLEDAKKLSHDLLKEKAYNDIEEAFVCAWEYLYALCLQHSQ